MCVKLDVREIYVCDIYKPIASVFCVKSSASCECNVFLKREPCVLVINEIAPQNEGLYF